MRAGPSQEDIRRHNLGALLRHVHLGGPISRAELTSKMGLNRSTIMALTSDLTAAGLVREELPRETGRAGRPSLVVRPESARVYVFAFDVSPDRLAVARVGLGGVILDRREAVRDRGAFELDELTGALSAFARQMRRKTRDDTVCVGAAAAVSGGVRKADGVVRFGPNLRAEEVPFGEELGRRLGLGLPVSVGNDANLAALAEHSRGVGAAVRDLIYLHGDVGIGGGIIAGGHLLGGHDGYGGEVGHMVVNPGGRACGCGSHGCLEAEVGERALLESAGRVQAGVQAAVQTGIHTGAQTGVQTGRPDGQQGRDAVRAVVEAADRGDIVAQEALSRVGDWLGLGVANLVNIFNPEMVIFGGMLREIYLGSAAQVRSQLTLHAMAPQRERLRLRTSSLGDAATLVGAAELAFAHVLSDPLEVLARANA
ncbi:Sugar kinase of the NBD/HSP70 family, may contain an N-terminal HTH domain [Nonomuraea solani]|uniref:Sugar kinase of the NBD/HSP70 family, may contain an N-terminal HTH domain n=1 Tax=Nonomuraea solani TaxID=1144553 RepID=A0A1H5ZHB2_9ACTN|nr:ROK family transcriptional regulator [Nonomuraea solani]SEG35849.1 Sugar kinase of the NBD/HSP70 family, may contain an N-terminal HTH domain [Nonomuraea solani]